MNVTIHENGTTQFRGLPIPGFSFLDKVAIDMDEVGVSFGVSNRWNRLGSKSETDLQQFGPSSRSKTLIVG
eukprot:3311121-Amphidinium_carterae.1